MLRRLLQLAGLALLLLLGFVGFVIAHFELASQRAHAAPSLSIREEVSQADPSLGRRIFHVRAGCVECHGADLGGARIMDNSAMGRIAGPNLTPFALKGWTDEQMATAIRYGIRPDGCSLKFMPCFDFEGMSKGDMAALIAYTRSVPPVERPSEPNVFGPVAKMLSALGKLPILFPADVVDPTKDFGEKPPEGATAEFGAYLAQACAGCHGEELRGGPIPGGDPSWPPAPSIRLGADPLWTLKSFRETCKSGVSARTREPMRPPMPVALVKQLDDTELKALYEHLRALK